MNASPYMKMEQWKFFWDPKVFLKIEPIYIKERDLKMKKTQAKVFSSQKSSYLYKEDGGNTAEPASQIIII